MKCPVCKKDMVEKDFGSVKVDVCQNGCKGIWFDWMEIIKLDEKNEGFGNALKDALEYSRTNDENRPKLKCPKCGILMHAHKYQSSKEVNVDECYDCAGFFLDSGELKLIRDTFMSEQEEEEYLNKLLKDIPSFHKAQDRQKKEKARAEALRHYTRFLRVSYYLGKK